jgi:hypothetical protein
MGLLRVEVVVTTTRIDSCRRVVVTEAVEETDLLLLLRRHGRAMRASLEEVGTGMMLRLLQDKDCPMDLRPAGEVPDYQVVLEAPGFRLLLLMVLSARLCSIDCIVWSWRR